MPYSEVECPICSELQCATDSRFATVLGNAGLRNLIGPCTDRLAVIPSLGALARGHTLIVTKTHSSGVLAMSTDEVVRRELRTLIEALIDTLVIGHTGSALVFEHGGLTSHGAKNLCSTTHGHIHFVPLAADVSAGAFSMIRGRAGVVEFEETPTIAARLGEYLALAMFDDSGLPVAATVRSAQRLESQFARRAIAKALGLTKWRWQEFENDVTGMTYLEQTRRFRRNVLCVERRGLLAENGSEALPHLAL